MPLSKVAIVYAQVSGRVNLVFREICIKIYGWVLYSVIHTILRDCILLRVRLSRIRHAGKMRVLDVTLVVIILAMNLQLRGDQ